MNSYPLTGFATVYKSWTQSRRDAYDQKIGELLKGQAMTKEAHEEALKSVSGWSKVKTDFAAIRRAIEQP